MSGLHREFDYPAMVKYLSDHKEEFEKLFHVYDETMIKLRRARDLATKINTVESLCKNNYRRFLLDAYADPTINEIYYQVLQHPMKFAEYESFSRLICSGYIRKI